MKANCNVKSLDSDWPYILTPFVKMCENFQNLDPSSNLHHIRNIWSKFGAIWSNRISRNKHALMYSLIILLIQVIITTYE